MIDGMLRALGMDPDQLRSLSVQIANAIDRIAANAYETRRIVERVEIQLGRIEITLDALRRVICDEAPPLPQSHYDYAQMIEVIRHD